MVAVVSVPGIVNSWGDLPPTGTKDPRLNLESAQGLKDHIKKDMTDLVHRRSCNSLL